MKPLATLAFAALVAATSAASAQNYRDNSRLQDDARRLDSEIRDNMESGRIDRRDGERALDQLRNIRDDEDRMRERNRGSLSSRDRDYLQGQLNDVERDVNRMRETGLRRQGTEGSSSDRGFDPGRELNRLLGAGPEHR